MRMAVVGRNPRAGGSECIVFGHVGRADDRFSPISLEMRGGVGWGEELSAFGDWSVRPMRPGAGLDISPALVASETEGAYCRTSGRLIVVSHSWSGVLQVIDVGVRYTVDLYSEATRLVLLDLVHEVMVDVTRLARTEEGGLRLPDLPLGRVVEHIVENEAWFRPLEPDSGYNPGALRRALERFRARPGAKVKLRILAALAPRLVAAPGAVAPPAHSEHAERLRDELRCLSAAIDGLALSAAAKS